MEMQGKAELFTSAGMPLTPSISLRLFFVARCANGSASHGICPRYSSKPAWSLSELMKTISKSRFCCFSLLYVWARVGVKPRHGGHQCALKYRATVLPWRAVLPAMDCAWSGTQIWDTS